MFVASVKKREGLVILYFVTQWGLRFLKWLTIACITNYYCWIIFTVSWSQDSTSVHLDWKQESTKFEYDNKVISLLKIAVKLSSLLGKRDGLRVGEGSNQEFREKNEGEERDLEWLVKEIRKVIFFAGTEQLVRAPNFFPLSSESKQCACALYILTSYMLISFYF